MNYGARTTRPRRAIAASDSATAARSRSMRRATTITTHQAAAQGAGALADRAAGGDVKVFVDTAAVMEKPLAAAAGLGWQGKHTNLVSRAIRLMVVPGRDLHHARSAAGCARSRSLRQLPRLPRYLPDRGLSGAVSARCAPLHFVSHHRAQRTDPARVARRSSATASMAATIAWRYARGTSSRRSAARRSCARAKRCGRLASRDLARLDDAAFRALFAKSPVKRTGRDRFVRNVLIAIGNSGDATLAPEAERLLDDPSPLVRGAAVWALGRLLSRERLHEIAARSRAQETEALVEAEWTSALANDTRCHSGRGTPDLSGSRTQRDMFRTPPPPRSGARCPPAATGGGRRP